MGIEVIQMISCNPCPKIGALTPKNLEAKVPKVYCNVSSINFLAPGRNRSVNSIWQ